MADLKISQLTGATTPLAGTEVVPLVQSSTTKKVAVSEFVKAAGAASSGTNVPAAGVVHTFQESASLSAAQRLVNRNSTQAWHVAVDAAAVDDGLYAIINPATGQVALTINPTTGNITVSLGSLVVGTAGKGVSLPGGVTWTSGSGSPENAVTAPVGSLYSRTDGGANTTLYVKESGSGNTGWVAK